MPVFTSAAEAVAEAIGDYIRTLFFEGDAIAEANASGTGVSTYGQEVMVVEGVNMVARDTREVSPQITGTLCTGSPGTVKTWMISGRKSPGLSKTLTRRMN